jgi:hypothetical protein
MDNARRVTGRDHFIRDRKCEIIIGLALFVIGSLLLYDAFDGRNKKVPWPGSVFFPW